MKSAPSNFISLNIIDQHHSHAIQMRIPTYTQSVCNLEPYSGIQGWCKHLWTLVDPGMYMCHVDIFPYYSLYFTILFFPKRHYHPPYHWQSHDRLSPSSQHHVWLHPPYVLLFISHSPVICKDSFPSVYMYKSSRYYFVFDINLGHIFPQSTTL